MATPCCNNGMLYFTALREALDHEHQKHVFSTIPLQNYKNHTGKVKTLLCHDMQGGYLCYDRFEGASLDEEQTLYTFFHWWYIDIFVYFSHNFITVPPIVWTNLAHRHGVIVLGTLITEGKGGAKLCKELFFSMENVDKLVGVMTDLCVEFGFDGWLINIENQIEKEHLSILTEFLSKLRKNVKERIGKHAYIIWYDSVTRDGKLEWQNELNVNNSGWFDVVDAMFLNYTWVPEGLVKSAEFAKSRTTEVFTGIDVFGRGQIGDGGWNCVEALAHVRQAGLSAAIFAPGWICEKFPDACIFEQSSRFWALLRDLLPVNRRVTETISTNFCHGVDAETCWFCMANAQVQPFLLGDDEYKSRDVGSEESGLIIETKGLRLGDGNDEQTLFLCDLPATNGFDVQMKATGSISLIVHTNADGDSIQLQTDSKADGVEKCSRYTSDRPVRVTKVTVKREVVSDGPIYLTHFSIRLL